MDLSTSAVVFLFFIYNLCEAGDRKYNSVLTVDNGGPWGEWGKIEFCSEGYARGYIVKISEPGPGMDDTGLNGIRLFCSNGKFIQSTIGHFGSWISAKECPKGYLLSFSLKVEKPKGKLIDDTAANGIQFNCGDGTNLKAYDVDYGTWGEWSKPCTAGAICGIQTKVELEMSVDITSLNDVKFYCCD